MDKLVREIETGSSMEGFEKNLRLCGPRVEVIGTRDWKSGVLSKDLLGDQETSRRSFQDVTVYHRAFCPDVSRNQRVAKTHNCTVTGTHGVHYCGFPIAMKAWMGTEVYFKSMDPDSEVKKRERLTKCILKLKDNKLAGVWIESSGSRKPRMLRKSLCSRQNSRVDELKVVNGNRVGQVVRGLRWNLNELAKAIDGFLRDNLKESGNRKTELDKSSMEEPKD
ncbi:hypothetical protein F2Q69_00024387 [Brassica cretica]|uniref:Uncharacterized protein n=1 Tax=Brassica cretica TaxID=69181 RepID=A0A8S9QSY7_BRACR|nr:hypothetical protein F2Q69_00024387 [Brassica cretica]